MMHLAMTSAGGKRVATGDRGGRYAPRVAAGGGSRSGKHWARTDAALERHGGGAGGGNRRAAGRPRTLTRVRTDRPRSETAAGVAAPDRRRERVAGWRDVASGLWRPGQVSLVRGDRGWSRRRIPRWKRGLDVVGTLVGLPLVLPVMILLGLWIRLGSRGPVLLRQERIGHHGKRFVLYKFRTMRLDADPTRHESYMRQLVQSGRPMIKLDLLGDRRLIGGGALLRAAGLDELPQLWNVLRGEMSLVGPRPCLPVEYRLFSVSQRERFSVLPGLTGQWQVNGKNRCTFCEMTTMDIDYVHRASLATDLHILLRTPAALAFQLWLAWRHANPHGWQPVTGSGAGGCEADLLAGGGLQRNG